MWSSFLILLYLDRRLRDVEIFYKIAKNFPLDLYFLNDPSYTMRSLASSLNSLANDIGKHNSHEGNNIMYHTYLKIIQVLSSTRISNKMSSNHLAFRCFLCVWRLRAKNKNHINLLINHSTRIICGNKSVFIVIIIFFYWVTNVAKIFVNIWNKYFPTTDIEKNPARPFLT